MRDVHKLKEKYELSLDTRQIFTLVFVGLVSLGGIFVLGVAVGRKLAAEDKVAQAPDLLQQLDDKEAALTTFQQELTRPAQKEAAAPKPKPVVVEAKPVDVKPPEAKPVEVAAVQPPAAAPVPAVEPTPDPAPAPSPQKLSDTAVVTRTAPPALGHDAGALKEAIARAQRPAEATADGNWTLQLSAYQDKAEADRFAADLRGKGYAPFVLEAHVTGKGTWYRVRMGRFPTKDAASRYLTDFRRETQIDAMVSPAN